MSEQKTVARALETNSYATSGSGAAGGINPTYWAKKIEEFAKANLVVAPLGVVYRDLIGNGESFKVNFNAEISAAALTETTVITPSAISYTTRTFTPTEYGLAVAITRKQRIRPMHDIMEEKARDMGYALAKLKDSTILTELQNSAGNSVVANGVEVSSVASTDVMTTSTLADALKELRVDDYNGKYLVIHPKQENNLIKLSSFVDASVYGGREVVMNGEIGRYLGMRVFVTTLVPRNGTTSTAYDAFMMDDRAFGIAEKMPITFNQDYKVLEREYIMAAVEEYDVKILQENATCKITAYGG